MKIIKISVLMLIFPVQTMAHVRWFLEGREIPDVNFAWDALDGLTLLGGAALLLVAFLLNKSSMAAIAGKPVPTKALKAFGYFLSKPVIWPYRIDWYVLILFLNLLFIINLMMGDFLAPNLVLTPQLNFFGVMIQVAAILLSVFSIALTGLALVLVGALLPIIFPAAIGLDYFFEVIGVGLAYLVMAPFINQTDQRVYKKVGWLDRLNIKIASGMAVDILRFALGLQLMALAVHNKLWQPGAALLFLQDFPYYNFMQQLGFDAYTHLHFVLAAGVFEFVLGLLLVLGWALRFVVLLLCVVFTATALLSGVSEVIGHLPIFAVLLILLSAGHRQHRPNRGHNASLSSLRAPH